jgi:hypothetical protein
VGFPVGLASAILAGFGVEFASGITFILVGVIGFFLGITGSLFLLYDNHKETIERFFPSEWNGYRKFSVILIVAIFLYYIAYLFVKSNI